MSFNKNFLNKNPLVNNGVSNNGPVKPSINEWVNSSNASNVSQDGVFYGVKPNVKTKSSMKPLVANEENPVVNKNNIPIKSQHNKPQGGGIASGLGDIAQADPAAAGVVGSVIPGVSEAQDATDMFTSLKKGDYLGAGISGIGLVTPFVGGRAIKGLLGTNKVKKATSRFMKEPTAYNNPVEKGFEVANDALTAMKQKGKSLDKNYNYFNYGDLTPDNAKFFGTKYGRSVAEVELPDGSTQLFYKSSGKAGKSGAGVGGTTEGLWQPYGGHANIPNVKDWFIKDKGYKDWYGSESFRNISGNLDRLAVEGGWDLSKQSLASVKKVTKK